MTAPDPRAARLEAITARLREGGAKPDRWFAFLLPKFRPGPNLDQLTAAAALSLDGDAPDVAKAVQARCKALAESNARALPAEFWVMAALTLAFGLPGELAAGREARSRLALAALGASPDEGLDPLAKLKAAMAPRVSDKARGYDAVMDVYAAALSARGERADAIGERLDEAEATFKPDRKASKLARHGARACLAFQVDPAEALGRFSALSSMVGSDKRAAKLPGRLVMDWAVYGLDEASAVDVLALAGALAGASKRLEVVDAQLGYLVWLHSKSELNRPAFMATLLGAAQAGLPGGSAGGDTGGG